MNKPFDYTLYLVTDGRPQLLERVEQALKGGVTCVQYREKKKPFAAMVAEAAALKELCHRYNVPLFINDYVDLAKAIEADGLHLGQDDENLPTARKLLPYMPIGISAATVEEAKNAEAQGAEYIGVGAVFPTASKDDATVVTQQEIDDIYHSVTIPKLLIGGINAETAPLITAPFDGLCVISAILSAENPEQATKQIRKFIK